MPPELSAWSDAQLKEELTAMEWLFLTVALVAIVGNAGLLFFARWSRPVFLVAVIAATVATFFAGPAVSTALEAFTYEIGLLVDGFVVALAYFSDARVYFERKTI